MQVDLGHRHVSDDLSLEDYDDAVGYIFLETQALDFVETAILAGSYVKRDIVAGWSDLDLIFLTRDKHLQLHQTRALSNFLRGHPLLPRIGVGLNVVGSDQFKRTRKFGGSPYMMTREVSVYGQVYFGRSPFDNLAFDPSLSELIEVERPLLIASALHNWRRTFFRDLATQSPVHCAQLAAKALLVLLQLEVGPATSLPINTRESLLRLVRDNPAHPAIPAIEIAIEIRANWLSYRDSPRALTDLETMAHSLERYPLKLAEK